MADWYCFKDKVKMEEASLVLSYLQLSQRVPGIKCPKCGTAYLTEELVMNVVHPAEEMFEQK